MIDMTREQENKQYPVLVVDLDGTLLKSDLLMESLVAYLLPAPWRLGLIIYWLLSGGRSCLKARVAEHTTLDGSLLPWNQDVVSFCESWVQAGGRVILATASNIQVAKTVTQQFTFLTEVMGSDESRNLKGERKAERLVSEFGPTGFDYIGNSAADLAVWKVAAKSWFVGSEKQRKTFSAVLKKTLTGISQQSGFSGSSLIQSLRPHQSLKNILVFIPLLAAHRWFDPLCWQKTVPVFCALCCMASASYVLNDLADLRSDRLHPRKKNRPLACGDFSIVWSMWLLLVLLVLGMVLGACSGWVSLLTLILYFSFSCLYSLVLKVIPVVEALFLSGLYTYRLVIGGVAGSVPVSPWLLAFSTTFFLGLAFLKRYVELGSLPVRESACIPGRGYQHQDLAFVLVCGVSSSFLSVVVLALYLDSSASHALYQAPHWLWGIGLAMLTWIIRVWFLAGRRKMDDDPVWFAARDLVTLVLALVCVVIIVLAGPLS
jgi:4-hydroxybenzoate polyprenyltransferase